VAPVSAGDCSSAGAFEGTFGLRDRESKQLLQSDLKLANAPAGRVKHGIGDRRRNANDGQLTESIDTYRLEMRILFFREDRVARCDVHTYWYQVVGETAIRDPSGFRSTKSLQVELFGRGGAN
jgi:hypothetical protein